MSALATLEETTPTPRVYWEVITPAVSHWLDITDAPRVVVVAFPSPGLRESYRRAREDGRSGRVRSFETVDDLNAWLES